MESPEALVIRNELEELGRLIPVPIATGHPGRDACNVIACALADPIHGERVRDLFGRLSEIAYPPRPDPGAEIIAILDEYDDVIGTRRVSEESA
jgi:hypothetical protein